MPSKQETGPLFFFSAGEPSGDIHAAELIEELRCRYPTATFVGYGGPEMERAGCHVLVFLTNLAVMWIGRVLWNLRTFLGYVRDAGEYFRTKKPDAVILVDFPGFNWLIAKKAKAAGIPVYYFMPPQIWAWAQWRIKKMKRLTDHVLCCLEFEEKWFKDRGCAAFRIGHPFLEEVRKRKCDENFIETFLSGHPSDAEDDNGIPVDPVLLLLPGSRNQEVAVNFSDMLSVVKKVKKEIPSIRPVVAAFKESQAESLRKELERQGELMIPVFVGRTPELMKAASCAFAVSGSVSMELLANKVPTVIYYRVGLFPHFISRFFRRVKYITLTNLLVVDQMENESIFYDDHVHFIPARLSAHERDLLPFPEYLVWKDESESVAGELIRMLTTPHLIHRRREELERLLQKVDAEGSPVANAADYIEKHLYNNSISQ